MRLLWKLVKIRYKMVALDSVCVGRPYIIFKYTLKVLKKKKVKFYR